MTPERSCSPPPRAAAPVATFSLGQHLEDENAPWVVPATLQNAQLRIITALWDTNWHPSANLWGLNTPQDGISIWQDQPCTTTCLRAHTDHRSILTSRYGPPSTRNSLRALLP